MVSKESRFVEAMKWIAANTSKAFRALREKAHEKFSTVQQILIKVFTKAAWKEWKVFLDVSQNHSILLTTKIPIKNHWTKPSILCYIHWSYNEKFSQRRFSEQRKVATNREKLAAHSINKKDTNRFWNDFGKI